MTTKGNYKYSVHYDVWCLLCSLAWYSEEEKDAEEFLTTELPNQMLRSTYFDVVFGVRMVSVRV